MKNISIGAWDGDQVQLSVDDNATVSQVLQQANLQVAPSQSVTAYSNSEPVRMSDQVFDGETYLLTGNQVSG
jgi:hypothetical protein